MCGWSAQTQVSAPAETVLDRSRPRYRATHQDTGAVRRNDGRGMHTTTARSLQRLPGGARIIDTPGLRTRRPNVDEATGKATRERMKTKRGG